MNVLLNFIETAESNQKTVNYTIHHKSRTRIPWFGSIENEFFRGRAQQSSAVSEDIFKRVVLKRWWQLFQITARDRWNIRATVVVFSRGCRRVNDRWFVTFFADSLFITTISMIDQKPFRKMIHISFTYENEVLIVVHTGLWVDVLTFAQFSPIVVPCYSYFINVWIRPIQQHDKKIIPLGFNERGIDIL